MAITFEEVIAEVDPLPRDRTEAPAPAAPPRAEDFAAQLERELRIRAERAERLCAD